MAEIHVPMRTVLEWHVYPPPATASVTQAYLFVAGDGGYILGWWSQDRGVYSPGAKREGDDDVVMYAALPSNMFEQVAANVRFAIEMDLRYEPPGSDRVIGLIRSPRRGRAELERLDKMVCESLDAGQSYDTMRKSRHIRAGSARDKIARQLWCFRTGKSKIKD